MINKLKPYAEYKESGLPWLGTVPSHWSVRRIKTILREVDSRSVDGLGTLLSLSRVRGLIPRNDMTDKMHSAKTLVGYKHYSSGQIVMNRMQAWSGMFGTAAIDGLVSPDYAVFKVMGGHEVKLILERLKAPDLVGQFALGSKGIGSGFNRLYTDRFGPIPITLPPPDEQSAIVRFLDYANGRLERTIRAKRKVIALLNEQKQVIIHRAVTRGLDLTVPLKSSGIPWLGDIPDHWEVRPLKKWVQINSLTLTEQTDKNYEFRYVDIGSVKTGYLAKKLEILHFGNAPSRARRVLSKGDTIISTVRTYLKAVWHVAEDASDIIASTGFAVLTPCRSVHPKLLGYVLQNINFVDQVSANSIGVTYPAIAETVLGRLKFPLPNNLDEQDKLVKFIESESRPIATAISFLEREIELLREYRTRLVADIVTGKLDVREAAKSLPEEEASEAAGDDLDSIDEIEPDDEEEAA